MGLPQRIIAVVVRDTRLAALKARWTTADQALFRLRQAAVGEAELRFQRHEKTGQRLATQEKNILSAIATNLSDDIEYENEDRVYQQAVQHVLRELDFEYQVQTVHRSFLPNFDFDMCQAVLAIGQDGLVANAAKYVGDVPLIGINPDPTRIDGILTPFRAEAARHAVQNSVKGTAKTRKVTLAEVNTNDGQRMLAFNDFFVGASSHVSARYTLEVSSRVEPQSSSGVIISTGAGSTGWLSSLFNMTSGFGRTFGGQEIAPQTMPWEDRRLVWAVREPFVSKHSRADSVAGYLQERDELVVGSQMPSGGVIFSDGVESDFVEFNSGTIARFFVSRQRATLVIP